MRAVVSFLVIATAVIGFAWWLVGLPGSVNAQIGGTTFGAPTSVALLFAIVVFVVLYILVRVLLTVVRLPGRTARMRAARDRRRGETALTRTLLALAGGDSTAARREARRSRLLLGDTPQTLLLAAYAGRQAGQQEEAEAAFRALAKRDDAAFLGLRGLMQQAMGRGDWEEAAQLARRAEEASPGVPWLRAERSRLAIRTGSWKEALTLAGPGDKVAVLGTAAANAEPDSSEARRLAKQAWRADPAFAPAALAYAKCLRAAGRERRAQDVLRTSWSLAPHPALAEDALATAPDDLARTRRAEALANAAPGHPESKLLLARVTLAAGLHGEAQRHAEEARAAGLDQRRVWLLLADIAEQSGNSAGQSDALRHAANAEPDPAWRCDQCGTVHAEWAPTCSHCGTTGRIAWGVAAVTGGTRLLTVDSGEPILP
jgi:HemY protein